MNEAASKPVIHKGMYSRDYLMHFDGGGIWQFISVHLADSVPKKVLDRWKLELKNETDAARKRILHRRVDRYLDQGYGECYLGRRDVADQVRESILHRNGPEYKLRSWVVMPNHIHLLMKPNEELELESILRRFKSYTANMCNRIIGRLGQFWQWDFYDRFIRDIQHFRAVVNYIEQNPVKARLCRQASEWEFSSAYINPSDDT